MARETKNDLINKIQELQNKNKELSAEIEKQGQDFQKEKSEIEEKNKQIIQEKESLHATEKADIEAKLNESESQNKEKQKLLDKREIKKLAQAYREQESQYKIEVAKWVKYLFIAFGALFVSTSISIYLALGKSWSDRIEYYLVDFILISIVWFCAAQYSYYEKLSSDFANRKTLAQTYHNIMNNAEDAEIKNKFLEKSTDVLCSQIDFDKKEKLPVAQILKDALEISKNVSKKI